MAKVIRYLNNAFLVLFAIPVCVLLRLVNLFSPLKLVSIRSRLIGHFVFDTEYHLRHQQLNDASCRYLAFFDGYISNIQWANMVRRRYYVNRFFKYMWIANRLMPGFERYEFDLRILDGERDFRDQYGILSKTEPQLTFEHEENIVGKNYLVSRGIGDNEKFICLIVRDSAYKEHVDAERNWSYHSYRDSELDTYKDAVIALAERGYWVFRMGKTVEKNFDVDHPKVVDYATSDDRSDFLDIWLMANCYFCVTTGTGLDDVAGVFNVPSVFVNLLPLNHIPLYKNSITVPKKLIWERDQTLLSLKEHMQHGYTSTEEYSDKNIRIVDLNSKEIQEAVLEMELTLRGEYRQSLKQVSQQETIIQSIIYYDNKNKQRYQYHQDPCARIGFNYLNRHWHELFSK